MACRRFCKKKDLKKSKKRGFFFLELGQRLHFATRQAGGAKDAVGEGVEERSCVVMEEKRGVSKGNES